MDKYHVCNTGGYNKSHIMRNDGEMTLCGRYVIILTPDDKKLPLSSAGCRSCHILMNHAVIKKKQDFD